MGAARTLISVAMPNGIESSIEIDPRKVARVEGSVIIYKSGTHRVTGETETNLRRLLEWSKKEPGMYL